MQETVRNIGTVIDWMNGTKQLLESDSPTLKALAMQKLQLANDVDWQAKRRELLDQLNASLTIAQAEATTTIKAGAPPHVQPYVPAERFGALFQSAMEEHLNDRVTSSVQAQNADVPVPYGPPEKFDSGDAGWSVVLLARLEEQLRGKHVFVHSADLTTFRYELPENTKVALFADWATAEPPALAIKASIEQRSPEYTIHLGDTYYAGFGDEIRHNLISCWPGGVQYQKSFAMNGNHEMYSGGNAYFDNLAIFGHSASYFNLGNQFWRLIALDTSWPERGGDKPASSWGDLVNYEVDWLQAQVDHASSFTPAARIILLTHHQLFSAYDGDDLGKYLLPHVQPFLDAGVIYAWFWGHEHRFIAYKNNPFGFKAWCIGNGGFPASPSTGSPAYSSKYPIQWVEQRPEPSNGWYGMRGFALLSFSGPQVTVEYVDQTGSVAYSEIWGG
jgi:calcineurin-like phosphoesterase family protein